MQALDAWPAKNQGCGGGLVAGNAHFGGNQRFTLVPLDEMEPESMPCALLTTTTTTTTTLPPTSLVDISSATCTEDGSKLETDQFIIKNVKDSYVVTADSAGKIKLAPAQEGDLSQLWRFGRLCSGKVNLVNVASGVAMGDGPCTFDATLKLIKNANGKYLRSNRKHKVSTSGVKWLAGPAPRQPWKWFQWQLVRA